MCIYIIQFVTLSDDTVKVLCRCFINVLDTWSVLKFMGGLAVFIIISGSGSGQLHVDSAYRCSGMNMCTHAM